MPDDHKAKAIEDLKRLIVKKQMDADLSELNEDQNAPTLTIVAKSQGRVEIVVEGEPKAILNNETLIELGLRQHMPWTDVLAEDVMELAERDRHFNQARKWLARKMMSEKQLRQKLKQADCSDGGIALVLELCRRASLIDDEIYGQALIDSMARRGAGQLKISRKLQDRGIGKQQAQSLIETHAPDHMSQLQTATAFAEKRLNSDLRKKQRLKLFKENSDSQMIYKVKQQLNAGIARHLASKGYPQDIVMEVCSGFDDLLQNQIELLSSD